VGRLVYEKGIHLIFYAVKDFDFNYKVLVIGSGPYKKNLETIAKKLNIDKKVIFLDWIRYNQLPDYYNCMDVLVLPSLTTPNWKEQFGRVLIEAMSCEVAVIGSSSGEIPIVIGECGLLFKENNVDELREKLLFLFKNCEIRKNLAKKGRKRVEENFDRRLLDKKTYQIYKSLYESPY
jgi:glycosyltransferase involved in cell wall biosynthesis